MNPRESDRRTIFIGDIHGCLDELQDLLSTCSVEWGSDRLFSVGDLVAKGPDSQGVIQFARERGILAVLGNHDAKVLAVAGLDGRGPKSEGSLHHAAVARTLGPEDWAYLRGLPLYRELLDLGVIVVHAGLRVGVALADQPRDLVINMRSIKPDGEPSKKVDEGVPWASRWPGPAHIVFGHDALRGLQRHPFATGLDTGCVYGRELTALIFPERRLVSVGARRSYTDTPAP